MGVCEGEVGGAEGEVQGQLPPEQDCGGEIADSAGSCPLCVGGCHALSWKLLMVQCFLWHAQVVRIDSSGGGHGSIIQYMYTIMCYNMYVRTCMFMYGVHVHVHVQ